VIAGPLTGHVALVAGATGAIGRHVVAELATAGAAVAVHYRRGIETANALVAAHPGSVAVAADLPGEAVTDALFTEVEARLGPVTILVNAVDPGVPTPTPVADLSDDGLAGCLAGVHVHHQLCRRAIPAMRDAGHGRIVVLAGATMDRPAAGMAAYASGKAAASVLTRYLALEEGRHGITANIVAPGRVTEPDAPEPNDPALRRLSVAAREASALGRFPTPLEVARTVTALASPGLAHLTGQTVYVTA
jgi:NAD(P)-dependent dehydrogenase (short-subunit alcohol dehydrogenase family)